MVHRLDHLQKHIRPRHICVKTVISSRVVHSARCLPVESLKQGNCCAAQASNYKKRDDFSVVARFRMLTPAAMST